MSLFILVTKSILERFGNTIWWCSTPVTLLASNSWYSKGINVNVVLFWFCVFIHKLFKLNEKWNCGKVYQRQYFWFLSLLLFCIKHYHCIVSFCFCFFKTLTVKLNQEASLVLLGEATGTKTCWNNKPAYTAIISSACTEGVPLDGGSVYCKSKLL